MKHIELTQGQRAIVDDEDFEKINQHKWYAAKRGYTFYAQRMVNKKAVHMHRIIMSPSEEQEVDHINGSGLDNRKENLRSVARTQNQWNRGRQRNNRSGYKGVGWNIGHNKWTARIKVNSKTLFLGSFIDKKEAALAYNKAAIIHHGVFARLNSI